MEPSTSASSMLPSYSAAGSSSVGSSSARVEQPRAPSPSSNPRKAQQVRVDAAAINQAQAAPQPSAPQAEAAEPQQAAGGSAPDFLRQITKVMTVWLSKITLGAQLFCCLFNKSNSVPDAADLVKVATDSQRNIGKLEESLNGLSQVVGNVQKAVVHCLKDTYKAISQALSMVS